MTTLYKLTDQNGYTRAGNSNACLWGPGVSHSGTGEGELCGPGWIHAYEHPLLAMLLNPLHAKIKNPRLWEAEGVIGAREGQLKVGCKTLTTTREIPLPNITTKQHIKFGILCAFAVCSEPAFITWANAWLDNTDRSAWAAWTEAATAAWTEAAYAARAAARETAYAAGAKDAAAGAAWAAYEATRVAEIDLVKIAERAVAS